MAGRIEVSHCIPVPTDSCTTRTLPMHGPFKLRVASLSAQPSSHFSSISLGLAAALDHLFIQVPT